MNSEVTIDITEAAGDWLDRLSAGDVSIAERTMFTEWLQLSPVHIAEFLRVSALHATLSGSLGSHPDWAQELLKNADHTVLDFPQLTDSATPMVVEKDDSWSRTLRHRLGIAALFLVVISAGFWATQVENSSVIATAIGEQRIVLLDDGSKLELNTDSRVRISMTENSRDIELIRGELLVDVATDPGRPFRVRTVNAVVEAIGTRFNVYLRNAATEVTVVEGRVSVDWEASLVEDSQSSMGGHLELNAGGKAVVAQNQADPVMSPANIERATAWVEQRLDFDDETVAAVAAEFNRYNRSRIMVADPTLAAKKISGVFDVNDPGAFVALLGGLNAVEIELTFEGHRTIKSKTAQVD